MRKLHFGKTLLLIALSATLLYSSLPVYAASYETAHDATQIDPRYAGLDETFCQLSIGSSGKATCYGDAKIEDGYEAELTLTLLRSTNGRNWSEVASWSGNGSHTISKDYYVVKGYKYQAKLTVKVYNNAGKYVATYSAASDIVSY